MRRDQFGPMGQPFGLLAAGWFVGLLVMACGAAAEQREAVPIEGERFQAELVGADAKWQLTFRSEGAQRRIAARDLVRWGWFEEPARAPVVVLAGGSLLVADVLKVGNQQLAADSDLFGLVKVPLDLVAGVVFRLPAQPSSRDRLLDEVAVTGASSDRAILVNGDTVTGRFQSIENDTVRLETEVGPLDIPIHRLSALALNPAMVRRTATQGLYAVVGFVDGSRLVAERISLDQKSLALGLSGGLNWATTPDQLAALQPLGGRVVYLSAVQAADYKHVPFLEMAWPYRIDRNVEEGWLRAGAHSYLKGLGVHSAARLTYALGGQYRLLQAELAIDDSTQRRGSVGFRVFVDGRQQYVSPTIRGGTPPLPISVDISGAKRLDLVVDFADRADELDHADWLEARVVK